ncbi:hypothetical protein QP300_24360, partial [Escherichia coli]|nr:hypothetical protein [Escherichia coli]
SGQIHLPVNYNMSSWCASGTVGTSFTPSIATGWMSISKGSTIESWVEDSEGVQTRIYVDACTSGDCSSDSNDFLWLGGTVSGSGWASTQCVSSDNAMVGISRTIPYGMRLRPAQKLVGGQVYTLTLNMNGGEVKSDSESELNSVIRSGHFVNDVFWQGGMRYNSSTVTMDVPVEVVCTATAKNDVDWGRLVFSNNYFEEYKDTGINVSC